MLVVSVDVEVNQYQCLDSGDAVVDGFGGIVVVGGSIELLKMVLGTRVMIFVGLSLLRPHKKNVHCTTSTQQQTHHHVRRTTDDGRASEAFPPYLSTRFWRETACPSARPRAATSRHSFAMYQPSTRKIMDGHNFGEDLRSLCTR